MPPDEVIAVWQAGDSPTRDAAEALRPEVPFPLHILHSQEAGVVPAENLALEQSVGDILFLIDDDAVPPADWVKRHLAHYADSSVGAVGGPADNFRPDGTPFPRRGVQPVGRLRWYGRPQGNMYDHPPAWRSRQPEDVDHLVGYNFSLRRAAFSRFEAGLRRYWQLFEMDACLQVKKNGYRVIFDYGICVKHYPTNTAYAGGRSGDLQTKIYNAAYNQALVLAKHSSLGLSLIRLAYLFLVGSTEKPGLAGYFMAAARFGRPLREANILARTWWHVARGWFRGRMARTGNRTSSERLPAADTGETVTAPVSG